jgi:thioesterase domain-containing protein
MQPKGSRLPFFCVAGMGGNLANLRRLALMVGEDQPFYGLQPPGLDGRQKRLYRVEALAEHYIEELLAFQPQGPFFLGGYSGGGVAAYEMARQLGAAGHQVGFLGFLDSFSPALPRKSYLARAKIHAGRMVESGPGYALDALRRRLGYQRATLQLRMSRVLSKVNPERYRYDSIGDSWITAERAYHPGTWDGTATLFRAAEETALSLWTAYEVDAQHGWGRYVKGGVEVLLCPGNHSSMCEEPHVQALAAKLRLCLQRAASEPVRTDAPERAAG